MNKEPIKSLCCDAPIQLVDNNDGNPFVCMKCQKPAPMASPNIIDFSKKTDEFCEPNKEKCECKEDECCINCGFSGEVLPDGTCWSSKCKGEYKNAVSTPSHSWANELKEMLYDYGNYCSKSDNGDKISATEEGKIIENIKAFISKTLQEQKEKYETNLLGLSTAIEGQNIIINSLKGTAQEYRQVERGQIRKAMQEHYWDSMENFKSIIMLHIDSIITDLEKEI
jgi:hypothetical protein